MDQIEEYYQPLSANEEAYVNPRVGEACCAMFTQDDGWYRAVVTNVTGTMVGVCYLDYGNSENLPLSRVKMLNLMFTGLPVQAFNAKIVVDGIPPSFEEKVVDRELTARIVKRGDGGIYVVELFGDNDVPLFGSEGEGNKQYTVLTLLKVFSLIIMKATYTSLVWVFHLLRTRCSRILQGFSSNSGPW